MEKIFLDATANQHPLKYDAMNKSRSPEVLCKHNLLNFKVLKIDTNAASWSNSQPNFAKVNGN